MDLGIVIEGEVGSEGWAATRRAVEHLSATLGRKIIVKSEGKVMHVGRRQDLRAIWGNISMWEVYSDVWSLGFDKNEVGEKDGWEGGFDGGRRGLKDFIDMSEDEWLQEIVEQMRGAEEGESSSEEEEEEGE